MRVLINGSNFINTRIVINITIKYKNYERRGIIIMFKNLDDMYVFFEGSLEPRNQRKAIIDEILELLTNIDDRHLDIMHYIITPNANSKFKVVDIYALRGYLLSLLENVEFDCRDFHLDRLELNQLKFIKESLLYLSTQGELCEKILKCIHRGLLDYPFPVV